MLLDYSLQDHQGRVLLKNRRLRKKAQPSACFFIPLTKAQASASLDVWLFSWRGAADLALVDINPSFVFLLGAGKDVGSVVFGNKEDNASALGTRKQR